MQIVIEIDEIAYRDTSYWGEIFDRDKEDIAYAIKNGTPLPKDHGRLIDADALDIYDVSPAYGMEVYGVTQDDIEDAPTIIEGSDSE